MNLPRIILLPLATTLAFAQPAPPSELTSLPNDPAALVQNLYTQVVARHPHGIPEGADWKTLAPYVSEALLHRFDLAKACSADWDRSNSDPQLEVDRASGFGIFSGEKGSAEPKSFKIQRTVTDKDGPSHVHVYVELTGPDQPPPYRGIWTWRVAAVVIREEGHFAIDDLIYINDNQYAGTGETKPPNRRLSGYLSAGCNGPRWIAHNLPNQPEAFVQGLYQQVVARKPLDIPWGEDWKVFAPYFSNTLLHRFDVYDACMDDWDKQNPNTTDKPPGLIEFDIFSGSSEEADPVAFQIERSETEKDGSVHVLVRLQWHDAKYTEIWRVADILTRENGRLVLDDIIFLRDPKRADDVDTRLSKLLTDGCDGPHWVGYRDLK
jgi:hypothetical protein